MASPGRRPARARETPAPQKKTTLPSSFKDLLAIAASSAGRRISSLQFRGLPDRGAELASRSGQAPILAVQRDPAREGRS
jgi:hypothetical protein